MIYRLFNFYQSAVLFFLETLSLLHMQTYYARNNWNAILRKCNFFFVTKGKRRGVFFWSMNQSTRSEILFFSSNNHIFGRKVDNRICLCYQLHVKLMRQTQYLCTKYQCTIPLKQCSYNWLHTDYK